MTQFAEFILLNAGSAGYSLNGYMDKDGNFHSITDRKDENGVPIKKRFKFSYNNRVLRIPLARKDEVDFLRNAPECAGSPNGVYDTDPNSETFGKQLNQVYFKEVNNEKDAELIIENEALRIKAQTKALSLTGQDLADIALLCGTNSEKPLMQSKRVLDYSGSNPKGFLDMVESPDFKTRALLRRAIDTGAVTRKGFMLFWSDVHLGNDEDSAVKYLMSKKDVLKAVSEKVNK